jgi:hypothetical protein
MPIASETRAARQEMKNRVQNGAGSGSRVTIHRQLRDQRISRLAIEM